MIGRVTPREGPRYNALRSEGDCVVMRGAVLGVMVMSVIMEGVAGHLNIETGEWGGGTLVI